MSEEEKSREELELVRCDLHNAYSILDGRNEEIERLNNIIKEVREYIESDYLVEEVIMGKRYLTIDEEKVLEILDKENK